MKKIVVGILFLVYFAAPDLCSAWPAKCLRVKGGDTIIVEYQGTLEQGKRKQREVHLYGVACPEAGQALWDRATQFTREMVEGKMVEVHPIDCDCRKRCALVAWVLVDGKNLNKELVAAGLAWWYEYYAPNERVLQEYQEAAKGENKGLWQDPNPCPPWDFRKGKCAGDDTEE